MMHIPGAKNRACDAILWHPTGDLKPSKVQLLDDIFHINHLTPPPELKFPSSFWPAYILRISIHVMIQKTVKCSQQLVNYT